MKLKNNIIAMKRNRLIHTAVAAGLLLSGAIVPLAQAQSIDALLDKLVEKGTLTVKEAKDLREETDADFKKAIASRNGMPDFVNSMKLYGDFRGRYDSISLNSANFPDRARFRYRLRLGLTTSLADDFEVGLRLTSGEPASGSTTGGNAMSGNSTFTGNGTKKFIYVDTAYGKWTPIHNASWNGSLTIGKMENPFGFSEMVYDPDYTPEGVAQQLSYNFNDQHSLKFVGGEYVVNESSTSSKDAYMFSGQLTFESKWSQKFHTAVGIGALSLWNSSMLNTANVPDQNKGNTRTAAGNLLYHYNPIVVDASATYTFESFPLYKGAFPIKLLGEYVNNPGASQSALSHESAMGGVTFGKAGKKGTWELSYRYRYVGGDSWWEELPDDDFGAVYNASPTGGGNGYRSGTNVRGHVVKASYSPFDTVTFSLTWFQTSLIHSYGAGHTDASRVFVDMMWKF